MHKTPILDEEGYPLFESGVAANYLVEEGIGSEKILREWASYDTVGNAYFARVIHTDPRQWRKLAVITSEFHMARTRETFKWVFSLGNPRPSYKLKFISVTDKGINPEIILPRIEKEVSEKLLKVKKGINDLKQFHAWLFANHEAYAVAAKPKRESGDVLKSY